MASYSVFHVQKVGEQTVQWIRWFDRSIEARIDGHKMLVRGITLSHLTQQDNAKVITEIRFYSPEITKVEQTFYLVMRGKSQASSTVIPGTAQSSNDSGANEAKHRESTPQAVRVHQTPRKSIHRAFTSWEALDLLLSCIQPIMQAEEVARVIQVSQTASTPEAFKSAKKKRIAKWLNSIAQNVTLILRIKFSLSRL